MVHPASLSEFWGPPPLMPWLHLGTHALLSSRTPGVGAEGPSQGAIEEVQARGSCADRGVSLGGEVCTGSSCPGTSPAGRVGVDTATGGERAGKKPQSPVG